MRCCERYIRAVGSRGGSFELSRPLHSRPSEREPLCVSLRRPRLEPKVLVHHELAKRLLLCLRQMDADSILVRKLREALPAKLIGEQLVRLYGDMFKVGLTA